MWVRLAATRAPTLLRQGFLLHYHAAFFMVRVQHWSRGFTLAHRSGYRAVHASAAATDSIAAGPLSPRAPPRYACPACGLKCFRLLVLDRHVRSCCADLLDADHLLPLTDAAAQQTALNPAWFAAAQRREVQHHQRAVSERTTRQFFSA